MKCMEGRFEESVPDLTEALALWDFNTMRSWPGCAIQEAILLASLGGMRFKSITEQEDPEEKRAQKEKALDVITRAIDLADEMAKAGGDPPPAFTDFLAGCHYIRGEVCDSLHRRQESLEAYERACSLWKSLGKGYDLTYCQALGRITARLHAMEETARSVEVGAELLGILKPYAERNRAAFGQQYMVALRNQMMGLMGIGDAAGAEAVAEELQAFEGKDTGNAPK